MAAKVYDLAEIIERERHTVAPLEVKAGDVTISIDPPILWPDAVQQADFYDGLRLLLGDDYDAYIAAGGTAELLFLKLVPEHFGADMGESSASTDS